MNFLLQYHYKGEITVMKNSKGWALLSQFPICYGNGIIVKLQRQFFLACRFSVPLFDVLLFISRLLLF